MDRMEVVIYTNIYTVLSYGSRARVDAYVTESSKINLKNESYLCSRMFARAKQENWHLKKVFRVESCISKMFS